MVKSRLAASRDRLYRMQQLHVVHQLQINPRLGQLNYLQTTERNCTVLQPSINTHIIL